MEPNQGIKAVLFNCISKQIHSTDTKSNSTNSKRKLIRNIRNNCAKYIETLKKDLTHTAKRETTGKRRTVRKDKGNRRLKSSQNVHSVHSIKVIEVEHSQEQVRVAAVLVVNRTSQVHKRISIDKSSNSCRRKMIGEMRQSRSKRPKKREKRKQTT